MPFASLHSSSASLRVPTPGAWHCWQCCNGFESAEMRRVAADDGPVLPPTSNLTLNEEQQEEQRQSIEFLAISLFLVVLFASQLLLYSARRLGVGQSVVPESGLLLLLGMAIGGLIRVTERDDVVYAVSQLTDFDEGVFFLILLPPIIFDAGYTLRRSVTTVTPSSSCTCLIAPIISL